LAKQILKLHDSPELRTDLGVWGRLWAENEYSMRACYQRIFAELDRLGLPGKFHIAPRVEFFPNRDGPLEIAYLDVPPPPPTSEQLLLLDAENRIANLQRDRLEILEQRATEISLLKDSHERLQAQSENCMTSLHAQLDLLAEQKAEQAARLQNQLDLLSADNNTLRVHIHNITQTRLWRMVGAVYPSYQRMLSAAFVPAIAKVPIKAIANWLGAKRDQGDRDE
jgi:hypothetical protein